MQLLSQLLDSDPSTPRVTVYDESRGSRMDFSAITLDNWAAKVANMLRDELDLEAGDHIGIALPANWQAVVIALGAYAAQLEVSITASPTELANDLAAVFVDPNNQELDTAAEIIVVTDDPFGRGVSECGLDMQPGAIDFSPTVRVYGDVFYEDGPVLSELELADASWTAAACAGQRVLTTAWSDMQGFQRQVLAPLQTGGSIVVVTGGSPSEQRLTEIATAEKTTQRI